MVLAPELAGARTTEEAMPRKKTTTVATYVRSEDPDASTAEWTSMGSHTRRHSPRGCAVVKGMRSCCSAQRQGCCRSSLRHARRGA